MLTLLSPAEDLRILDFSFEEGKFTDFGFEDLLAQDTYSGTTVDTVVTERLTGKDNLDEVGKQYNLSNDQVAKLRELDLTKTTEKGNPYYLLYKQGNDYKIGYSSTGDGFGTGETQYQD